MAVSKNTIKTFMFMAALTALLLYIGSIFKGGMAFAIPLVLLMNFAAYFWSDKMVLATTRSKPVTEEEAPWLYRIVRELTQKTGMPMPRLYIMPAAQPNAFATGRNPQHAVVAVTEGILGVLNEEELKGVLAHELAHVRNRDILIGAVAAMVAGVITMISRFALFFGGGSDDRDNPGGAIGAILGIILAPIAALLIQMAVSRSRESQADASGAALLGDATPLANALIKIDAAAKQTGPMNVNPSVAHVFLQSPFRGQNMMKLFMSHPPLEQRLAQLRELGARV